MASVAELITAASGAGPAAMPAIEELGGLRRQLARALLASSDPEPVLAQRLADVAPLAASAFPWDPVGEDYELAQAILGAWGAAPNVLLAAMALAPAHHFPVLDLSSVPAWLRATYATFLLGRPPIFLHSGEADRYADHGVAAMQALYKAVLQDRLPEAVELAGAVMRADSTMIFFGARSLRDYFQPRARIVEWFMLRQGHDLGWTTLPTPRPRPKIGVLHRSLSPGSETFHLLAHLVGRDREAADVIVYAFEPPSEAALAPFEPWVTEVVQLPAEVPAAVQRVRADALDLCLLANNVAWGMTQHAALAAHRLAGVQIVSGASPATVGFSSADLFLTSRANDPSPTAADDYEEALVLLPGAVGHFAYAFDREPQTVQVSRAQLGVREDQVLFFSGANYFKLTPDLLEAWARLLACAPDSVLALIPFNPNWTQTYPVALFMRRMARVLARFGVSSDRVKAINPLPARADVQAVMALADVYLDSFPYSGACSLVDPLSLGLPIVARRGRRLRSAQGGSLLDAAGLEAAVCADTDAYIARALRLAKDAGFRRQEADLARAASAPEPACLRTEAFARRFSDLCVGLIQTRGQVTEGRLKSKPDALKREAATWARRAADAASPLFQRLTDAKLISELVVPYLEALRSRGETPGRAIDIGACVGLLSTPILKAGFAVDMFEPDPECAPHLAALVGQFPQTARHRPMAVVWDAAKSVTFNKRGLGLSGLGDSPYAGAADATITVEATTVAAYLAAHPGAVDFIKIDAEGADFDILGSIDLGAVAPRLVMVEFGTELPGQSGAQLAAVLKRLRAQGYDAMIFEYVRAAGFAVSNWDHRLVAVSQDAKEIGETGDGFGNILFYRQDDPVFPTLAIQLFEACTPARQRPPLGGLSD